MRRLNTFAEQKGFLTIAQNNSTTDYLQLAYCQALSIKCSQHEVTSYAVIVDTETNKLITEKHKEVFDYVILLPEDDATLSDWKFQNEWKVWALTPFKETIKLESDILFSTSIDHWWVGLQQTEICLTSHILDYEGTVSICRAYRKLFDDNLLPDVYNGIMYFRYGQDSYDFFSHAKQIFQNWNIVKTEILKNCRDEEPTTDVVYALATLFTGIEKCTNPALSYPTFVHMKGAINGWAISTDWTDKLYAELDTNLHLTVGFTRQMSPFHYQQKKFITKDIINKYEQFYRHTVRSTSVAIANNRS